MHRENHSEEGICLVCGCAGGLEDRPLRQHQQMGGVLCEICYMELGIEFYEEVSGYFDKISNATGLDIWECKKRYLQELASIIRMLLAGNDPDLNVKHRSWNLEQCQKQIQAISAYQREYGDDLEEALAYRELQKAMKTEAFGLDLVIPGLITVNIE